MNNFNRIFQAIKATQKDSTTSFDTVASEVNIQRERVEFYLNCLSEVGLIEYNQPINTIRLTTAGSERHEVFVAW